MEGAALKDREKEMIQLKLRGCFVKFQPTYDFESSLFGNEGEAVSTVQ